MTTTPARSNYGIENVIRNSSLTDSETAAAIPEALTLIDDLAMRSEKKMEIACNRGARGPGVVETGVAPRVRIEEALLAAWAFVRRGRRASESVPDHELEASRE